MDGLVATSVLIVCIGIIQMAKAVVADEKTQANSSHFRHSRGF
jgi:hypothetical protein